MGRKALRLDFIANQSRRANTFRKRLESTVKKAYEIHSLTGALVELEVEYNNVKYVFENGYPVNGPAVALVREALGAKERGRGGAQLDQPEQHAHDTHSQSQEDGAGDENGGGGGGGVAFDFDTDGGVDSSGGGGVDLEFGDLPDDFDEVLDMLQDTNLEDTAEEQVKPGDGLIDHEVNGFLSF